MLLRRPNPDDDAGERSGITNPESATLRKTAPTPRGERRLAVELLDDLGDPAGADGTATLPDREPQTLVHGHGLDQLHRDVGVVTGHHHLGAFRQRHHTGHVRGAEVELRTVVVEERRVAAALVLGQDVDLALELGVRRRGAGLHDDLAALDILTLHTADQQTDVVAGLALVEQLAEHLDTGDGRLGGLRTDADDLDFLVDVDHAALDTTGDHGAAAGDREDVLDGHQERLVGLADRVGDRLVDRVHQLFDALDPLLVTLERLERRHADDRGVLVELLGGQQFTDLHLDELDELLVVDGVRLVQRHQDVGHADLTGQQHVLTRLRHRTVGGRNHQDRAVHLGRAGDHVLDVVGVAGSVYVCVVTLLGLVLHVGDVDRDAARLLFGRVVDLVEGRRLVQVGELVVQNLRNSRSQRGLAVVNVTNGPDVDVRLRPLELRLRHFYVLLDCVGACCKAGLIFAVVVRRGGNRSDLLTRRLR